MNEYIESDNSCNLSIKDIKQTLKRKLMSDDSDDDFIKSVLGAPKEEV